MRKNKLQILSLTLAISALPALSYANNWSGYRGVERRPYHESQQTYQPPAQDPFAFSNQRYTPTAPPKGYYYQPYQNNHYSYQYRPSVSIEYYPETHSEHTYHREAFVIGNELPSEFRSERYVIRDWDYYSLRKPPRGRHWVMIDGRYFLVTDDNFRIEIIR
ncbi:hypothetical protein ABCA12_2663 [Acinetobacter junii]|uniref:RcnB family protein n=1 Tax=Acinetobacter junii TaxID=40215 RepID=UPI00191CBF6D|nr:RcnB family protein [Acinetobacter junii]QQV67213.1 hypothetical protein ABCA12_2663 [Acinetobacter junii]